MLHPDDILQFWFADACESPAAARARNAFWFSADRAVDEQIWEMFSDDVSDAANGHYQNWGDTAMGRLALIIALDQFPRNIFRGTAEVYHYDGRALQLAQQGVTLGQLAGLTVPEQAFFLMPYQHSEDLAVQDAGVALYDAMVMAAPPEWRELATGYHDFAIRHRDIIAEYGRFPYRNSVLGRHSTAAESRYLAEGGPTFGQAS
jgi:uncharacterized protein (DUF924 family)